MDTAKRNENTADHASKYVNYERNFKTYYDNTETIKENCDMDKHKYLSYFDEFEYDFYNLWKQEDYLQYSIMMRMYKNSHKKII